jgi:hypothetical protein
VKTIKIHTEEDLSNLTETEDIRLEIYLKNAIIPISYLSGELYVRAVGCQFPNLTHVHGLVSLDAHKIALPTLTEIHGNLNIHGANIQLPKLEKILGDLKQHFLVELPNVKVITGKSNTLKSRIRETWQEISSQKQLDALTEGNYYNLKIQHCDVTLHGKIIYGNLHIVDAKVNCPNLEAIFGEVTIEISDEISKYVSKFSQSFDEIADGKVESLFESPKLQTMHRNLEIGSKIPLRIAVKEVIQKITIYQKGKIAFNRLTNAGSIIAKQKAKIICNALAALTGKLIASSDSRVTAKSLYKIGTHCELFSKIDIPNIMFIEGNLIIQEDYYNKGKMRYEFKYLEHVGKKLELSRLHTFPNLKEIKGLCTIRSLADLTSATAPKLTHIGTLTIKERSVFRISERLPSLQSVGTMMYQENTEHLAIDYFYHKVENRNREFILSKESFSLWTNIGGDKLPIRRYIAILKMRHNSFDTFYTREVSREWTYEANASFDEILASIKRKWKKVKSFTYEDIFQLHDFSIRRFAFNYVGVDVFMKKLKAKRIATEGIEVTNIEYDALGNKKLVKKHNIFEVYEADFNKVQHFRSWRGEKQLRYAVKCWCTSTNKEHWIWVEEQYKDDPLAAIASTFRVHENVIPYINCLKRQGDILLCEMKRNVRPVGTIRPLTKEEYFGLLVAEF